MAVAVLFPGQGTQKPGMGLPWLDTPAWEVVERAEAATGEPLGELVTTAPAEALGRTREAQLAVLLASLLAWEAVKDEVGQPAAFAGHSLGQVAALIAAGALELEDGVALAAARASATQAAADRTPGRMAAVLGASVEAVEEACAGGEGCWLANDNAPGQVVVAGTPEAVDATAERARTLGARKVMALAVDGAFHTPLMADARAEFAAALSSTSFSPPSAPVVSNEDAASHVDAEGWRTRLADHLVRPVRWRQSMQALVELGADELLEVGGSGVLAGMARRTVEVPVS